MKEQFDDDRQFSHRGFEVMADHTPTPWGWWVHDHSMASLGVLPDPGLGDPLVLTISPCQSCADRAEHPKEWKWGRCHTPSEADAAFIVTACNAYDELKASLAEMVGIYWGDGDGIEPPPACIQRAIAVLASIKEAV